MFKLKDIIFNFFGLTAKTDDLYKDDDNKGFSQRYNELLANDLDENELDLINFMIENLVDPFTLEEKYLAYEEARMGIYLSIYLDNYFRRKIIPLMYHLYDIKGTIPAYEQFLRMIGFDTVEIVEGTTPSGFDNPTLTFDDEGTFDSSSSLGGFYNIILTGTLTITDALALVMYNIIKLNEPIWATLTQITYNGDVIVVIEQGNLGSFNSSFNTSFDI